MAKWSAAAKAKVRSYRAYTKKLKTYTDKYDIDYDPVSYREFSVVYNDRLKQVIEGDRKSIGNVGTYLIQRENKDIVKYQQYQAALYRRTEAMMKRGIDPVDGLEKSFQEFRQAYYEYEADLRKEIEAGERKSIGNIVGRIVSDQVYDMSSKQYDAIYKAITEWNESHPNNQIDLGTGNKLSLEMKIRQGEYLNTEGWWDLVKATRADYIKKGLSKREANYEIRRTLFGSP